MVKFGVRLPNSGPFASVEAMTQITLAAERLGFDTVSVHDHVNWGPDDRYHFYAGSVEAADAASEPFDFYGAFPTMGYLAGITERVRIIPAAMCLGWRHPLVVAREASTLYALSRGRFVLSVCPGNVHHDFDITGNDWDERGKRTEDSLQVFRKLIDEDSPFSFKGKTCAFEDAMIKPRPEAMQLWYGGTSKVALRRVAQYCDGWIPAGGPGYFREVLPQVQEQAQNFGRGHASVEAGMITRMAVADTDEKARAVSKRTLEYQYEAEWLKRHDLKDIEAAWLVGTPDKVAGQIDAIADAGVGLILNTIIAHTVEDVVEQMERLARDVVPLTRSGALS